MKASTLLRTAALAAGISAIGTVVWANHLPADKIGVAGSVIETMVAQVGPGSGSSGPVTLLSATLHNSTPTDLMIQVTGECALWTDVIVAGTSSSESVANVKTWVEIDGQAVPVTNDSNGDGAYNDPDDGRVVFCNRDTKLSLTGLLPNQVIDLFNKTRTANAFNWVTFNVGNGDHNITVKGQLDVSVAGTGVAKAAVGKRTLIVEPAKLANDATI